MGWAILTVDDTGAPRGWTGGSRNLIQETRTVVAPRSWSPVDPRAIEVRATRTGAVVVDRERSEKERMPDAEVASDPAPSADASSDVEARKMRWSGSLQRGT